MAIVDKNFKLEMSDIISVLQICTDIYSGKSETAFVKAADLKVYEKHLFLITLKGLRMNIPGIK